MSTGQNVRRRYAVVGTSPPPSAGDTDCAPAANSGHRGAARPLFLGHIPAFLSIHDVPDASFPTATALLRRPPAAVPMPHGRLRAGTARVDGRWQAARLHRTPTSSWARVNISDPHDGALALLPPCHPRENVPRSSARPPLAAPPALGALNPFHSLLVRPPP